MDTVKKKKSNKKQTHAQKENQTTEKTRPKTQTLKNALQYKNLSFISRME